MPQAPAHAVKSLEAIAPHCAGPIMPLGTSGSLTLAGKPESSLLESGTGPVGVRDLGVWQSPQPAAIVRYLPRSTWESSDFWDEQPAMHSITVSNRKRETPNSVVCCRSTSALLLRVGIVNEEGGGNCPLLPDYITREGCWGGGYNHRLRAGTECAGGLLSFGLRL